MGLQIGVIGAGGMGREHAANLTALPDVDVVVVADVVSEAAAAGAAIAGAESSTDPGSVAARTDLDGLVIASPDHTHAALTIAAIHAGTPTLCEKPLADNVADAQAVVDAENAAGKRLVQVGFMREYDAAHLQLEQTMADLGALHHLRCVHRNTNVDLKRDLALVCSQSLIHDVHTTHWLSGSEFTAVMTQVVMTGERIEHVVVLGELANGASVTLEFVEANYGYDVEVEATCAHGMVIAAQPGQPIVRSDGSAHRYIGEDWFGRFRAAYQAEAADWIDSVRHRQARGPSTAQGLAAQRVIAAAITSAETGQRTAVT